MHLYRATVKLKNSNVTAFTHELPMRGLTAPEVLVLKRIHGDDSVTNLRNDGERNVKQREEIDRLRSKYVGRDEEGRPVDVVAQVFGPVPNLPLELDIEAVAEEDEATAEAPSTKLGLPKK